MARPGLILEVQDRSGNAITNQAVTVLEYDGTTAYTGTLFDAPSGGSAVVPSATQPSTNSLGRVELYPSAARRVKVRVDASNVLTADIMPDPATILTQLPGTMVSLDAGATITRDSGASSTAHALTVRDTNAAGFGIRVRNSGDTANLWSIDATQMALAVPYAQTVNTTGYAATFRNSETTANLMQFYNPSGTQVGLWNKEGLQLFSQEHIARLSIGRTLASNTPFSLALEKTVQTTDPGWTLIRGYQEHLNSLKDDSACSIIASQIFSGDNRVTPVDLNAWRTVGTGASITLGLEVGLNSTIAPAADTDYHHGILITQNVSGFFGTTAALVPQASGLRIQGDSGWNDFIRCWGQAVGVTQFRVSGGFRTGDKAGDVIFAGDAYTTGMGTDRVGILDHRRATAGTTWTGVSYDATQVAWVIGTLSNGGTGFGKGLINPSGGALGIGVPTTSGINANTKVYVNGRIAALSGTSATQPAYAFTSDISSGVFSDTVGVMSMATAGVERGRWTSGGILDFRDPTRQVFAPSGATIATLAALGSGPTTATMASWLKIATNGTTGFLGVWR